MLIRRTILSLVILVYLVTSSIPMALAGPQIVGQAAVLIDSKSGKIVYAKNENTPMAPASTTKILTAILALEKCKPTDSVSAGKNATVVEPSAIGLKEGETITMENLLYSLMLKSANDAAIAIAEHVSGSVREFSALMNRKIREWGATNSNFINPNGLPDPNHYTTAHDLAIIAKHAMENQEFRNIVATKVKTIPRTDDTAIKWLQNHNKLLWRYDGANGIKTGYTKEAKQCLVASADRGGQEFIAVILSSEGTNVWSDAETLLNYGFTAFSTYKQKDANTLVRTVKVKKGTRDLALVTDKDFYYTLPKGQNRAVSEVVEINSEIKAPITKGQLLGKVKFVQQGEALGAVNLVAQNDVPAKRITIKGKTFPTTSILAAVLVLVSFIAWKGRKRKRRKSRLWINRNAIR
ncbi:MAG: D-alanyl-D-alanine carboxypeptidase family protein [Eubacteriales bacterium]